MIYSLRFILLTAVLMEMSACKKQDPVMTQKLDDSYVVETEVVKRLEQFSIVRRYIGTIRAEKFSLLSPKSLGTVASIHVNPGQKVKKDDLLVSLTTTIDKRALELAEQSVQLSEKEYSQSKSLYKNSDISRTQLRKSERDLLTARSQLEEQKRQVENVELRAPFAGVVGVPRVVLGETVQAGSPVVSIMDGPFSVMINIPASRLSEVNIGQTVRVKAASTTISAVERSIDPVTRTGFAKAIFSSCNDCIVGDSVTTHVTVQEKSNVILIDRNAIYYKDGKPRVVVVTKNEAGKFEAHIREITTGVEQEGKVEVVAGLNDGEEVVIANPKRLQDGMVVRVLR